MHFRSAVSVIAFLVLVAGVARSDLVTPGGGYAGGTLIGSSGNDNGFFLATAADGDVYVAGHLRGALSCAAASGYDSAYNSLESGHPDDIYVARFSSDLSTMEAFTFLGGNSLDWVRGLAVDPSGDVFVAGYSGSTSLILPGPGWDTTRHDHSRSFVVKFDADLQEVLGSTWLQGEVASGVEITGMTLDASGNVFVCGTTRAGFPATSGAWDTTFATHPDDDFTSDAFVAKFDNTLTTLSAATYLGGVGSESSIEITAAPDGGVYVSGSTAADDYPTTSGAYDTSFTVSPDAYSALFVTRLNGALSSVTASTILSEGVGQTTGMTVDASGVLYLVGNTELASFPSGTRDDTDRVFVVAMDANLTDIVANRLLSFSAGDYGYDIEIDGEGRVVVTGATFWYGDEKIPISEGAWQPESCSHSVGMIARFDDSLSTMDFSTVVGGWFGADVIYDAVVASDGVVYTTGFTQTENFPVASNGFCTACGGAESDPDSCYEGFVVAVDPAGGASAAPTLQVSTSTGSVSLSWSAASGAAAYRLYYAPAPFAGMHTVGVVDLGAMQSLSAALPTGFSLMVAVEALDGAGRSLGLSNVEIFTIP